MPRSLVLLFLFAASPVFAVNLVQDSLDVTPVAILSPSEMQFGPFFPHAIFAERAGAATSAYLICEIRELSYQAVVYLDTILHDFESTETYTAVYSEAALDPGGYVITFWAEEAGTHSNISYPPMERTFGYSSWIEEEPVVDEFNLDVRYSSGTVSIRFSLSHECTVDLDIYDVAGNVITNLASRGFEPGTHLRYWDASNETPGVYFIRLANAESFTVHKLLLLD